MKDHLTARFVNELRDVAVEFGRTQQLRSRLSKVVAKYVSKPLRVHYRVTTSKIDERPKDCTMVFPNYVPEDFDNEDVKKIIRRTIFEKHKGWSLIGYCIADD